MIFRVDGKEEEIADIKYICDLNEDDVHFNNATTIIFEIENECECIMMCETLKQDYNCEYVVS